MNSNYQKVPDYEQLWKKFVDGDMYAFRKIYANFYPQLLQFGLIYLNKSEAENLTQDVFLYILQKRNTIKKVKNVKAYLLTSLRNRISAYAKANKIKSVELPNELKIETTENYFVDIIHQLLNKLSPREQEIIRLRYFEELNNKEISKTLNIEYQTVRNTLANAIKKMRILFLQFEFA